MSSFSILWGLIQTDTGCWPCLIPQGGPHLTGLVTGYGLPANACLHRLFVQFDRRYSTARFQTEGEKRLYFKQNSNQWKIVGEFFKKGKIKHPATERVRLSNLKKIERFIYLWRDAWEKKDLNTYISYYDSAFRSRGMDLKRWKRHQKRLNEKYQPLRIKIRDLKIVMDSNKIGKVSFKQHYQADGYQDFGLKNRHLIKKGNIGRYKKRPGAR